MSGKNALVRSAAEELKELWEAIPAKARTKKACALVNEVIDNRRSKARVERTMAKIKKQRPTDDDGGKDWDSFFSALADFINSIAPLFVKD